MPCIQCGEQTPLKERYCRSCYQAIHPFMASVKPFVVRICKNCGRHCWKNKWIHKTHNEAIIESVKASLIFSKAQILAVDVVVESAERSIAVCVVSITGINPGYPEPAAEEYRLEAKLDFNQCDQCNQKGSSYFEAVVQLRCPTPEVERFIVQTFKSKNVHIAKTERTEEGLDYFVDDAHFAQNVGERLKARFGGILKITERLFTQNPLTSKLVYRVSVYYKPPQVEPSQVILIDGKVVKITGIKDKISGIDLSTGKRVLLADSEGTKKLQVIEAVVSKTVPHLEVISPETFQSTPVVNQAKVAASTVKVVCHDGKVWLVSS